MQIMVAITCRRMIEDTHRTLVYGTGNSDTHTHAHTAGAAHWDSIIDETARVIDYFA